MVGGRVGVADQDGIFGIEFGAAFAPDPVGEASGIPAGFFFLPSDPREKSPMLVNLIHLKSPFNRMKLRHELWKKTYPDAKEVHGIPWTGIENATPEIQALAKKLGVRPKKSDLWSTRGFVDGDNSGSASFDWAGRPQ